MIEEKSTKEKEIEEIVIDPKKLIEYVENSGWVKFERKRKDVAVYQKEVIDDDGENTYQINIPLEQNLLDYQESMKEVILTIMKVEDCTEFELYQNVMNNFSKLVTNNDYEWHSYGYIEGHPVKYRAEKNGEICMILSYKDTNISTVYHHPEILHRKIQNGQDGKFYDEDLKVAFYKLQSEYYYHLSKEMEQEVVSKYLENTDKQSKGDLYV